MSIHESAENYLETILILKKRNNSVRSIDIVAELNYTKPSVSRAMKLLREGEYITMDENGYISFTEKGNTIAQAMYERHNFLADYLMSLGVDRITAIEDACRIEHVISQQTFEKIRENVKSNKDLIK